MTNEEIDLTIEWAKHYAILRKSHTVIWLWHGGEPMLLGATKFRSLTETIRSVFAKEGIKTKFQIQTNLTLLNEGWIDVFKDAGFDSIGGSLDFQTGARIDAMGRSYDEIVLKNIRQLKNHKIDVGCISLVTPQNINHVQEMYCFFKSNGLDFKTARYFPSTNPTAEESMYATTDQQYAEFLCSLYDIWVEDKNPRIKILNLLEMATGLINGRRKLCTAEPGKCYRNYLCFEGGGEIYNCGRYDTPKYRLGTIYDTPETIAAKVNRRAATSLQTECINCPCLPLCNGGCPFERETSGRYLNCLVTKKVLTHIATHLKSASVAIKVDPCA